MAAMVRPWEKRWQLAVSINTSCPSVQKDQQPAGQGQPKDVFCLAQRLLYGCWLLIHIFLKTGAYTKIRTSGFSLKGHNIWQCWALFQYAFATHPNTQVTWINTHYFFKFCGPARQPFWSRPTQLIRMVIWKRWPRTAMLTCLGHVHGAAS